MGPKDTDTLDVGEKLLRNYDLRDLEDIFKLNFKTVLGKSYV